MMTVHLLSASRFKVKKYKCPFLLLFGTLIIAFPILMSRHDRNATFKPVTTTDISDISPTSYTKTIQGIARDIARGNTFVMVTLINEAFIPFTLSWLCNTKHMNIHQHVLFLTTDNRTDTLLHMYWPGVKSVILQGVDSKRNETYSQVGYVKLMVIRTETIMSILEGNIAVFLFEVDCLWLKNPVHFLQAQNHVDIVASKVSNRNSVIAGGFLYLFSTKTTKNVWRALTKRMMALSEKIRALSPHTFISEGKNDQQYLSTLIRDKYEGIRIKLLNPVEFPDGKWYKLSEKKRMAMDPYIVNNNWIIGNAQKIDRAKKWKHWFLKDDYTCDERNVALILKSVKT